MMSRTIRPRSIDEIAASADTLTGQDSQTLTTFVQTHPFSPAKDFDDPYGYSEALRNADALRFHQIIKQRRSELGHFHMAVSELFCLRWGPLELPLFSVILNLIYAFPGSRKDYLNLTRYLTRECSIPVDAVDLAGSSALMHAISTKPFFDQDFAAMLRGAGAKINRQDRHGRTAGHYIVDIEPSAGTAADLRASDALRYYIAYGGAVDIPDGSGVRVIDCASRLRKNAPQTLSALMGGSGTCIAQPPSPPMASKSRPFFPRSASSQSASSSAKSSTGSFPFGTVSTLSRPALNRVQSEGARSAQSITSLASSGGGNGDAGAKIQLPGITCPCQRRGMWRVCCGVPPDMQAIRSVVS